MLTTSRPRASVAWKAAGRSGRALMALVGLAVLATSCSPEAETVASRPPLGVPPAQPNIVLILTDDVSMNLVAYMSEVRDMQEHGIDFTNSFVTSPLCCPSRGTILTGKYPHSTGIETNHWPNGGFGQFVDDMDTSLGPSLQRAGYRTGFIGKFLNGYEPTPDASGPAGDADPPPVETLTTAYVPPGWDEWHVPGHSGYGHFGYDLTTAVDTRTGAIEERLGTDEEDYLTDVMAERATSFIDRATTAPNDPAGPFFLTVSTFAAHPRSPGGDAEERGVRFPPAARDRLRPARPADWPIGWARSEFRLGDCGEPVGGGCADVAFPDPATAATFNQVPSDAPDWMPRRALSPERIAELEAEYLDRVRMMQSVNDLIRSVRSQLEAAGVADRTYLVFTSDNGFHLGEHGLDTGKRTAFDHDVRVPLVVLPPGGIEPVDRSEIVQGTDLLPTFLDLAGADIPAEIDGRSLAGLLGTAPAPDDWREGALVEQHRSRPIYESQDVDLEPGGPPSYFALRTATYLYVDYGVPGAPGGRLDEFYDLRTDPDQMANVVRQLDPADHAALRRAVLGYHGCTGATCLAVARDLPDPFG
ncbi:MAG: sulfatase [Actinomycetota bacterium]|nr:sulfatase [Actinomycetota bacterium]